MMNIAGRTLSRPAALVLGTLLLACESSDVIAPDGSTISLSPNPATIVLSGGVQRDPVTIVATVANSIGVPLPGQDIRFTTTAGTLNPPAGTAVTTDGDGNATTILTDASQPATVTARSGKATASLQIQTATCSLSSISLGPSPLQLDTCGDEFDLTAVATDTSGDPCAGIQITFTLATGSTDVSGTFLPAASDITDANGEATTTFDVSDTDCNAKCKDPSGATKTCTQSIRATSGGTTSAPVTLQDNIQ